MKITQASIQTLAILGAVAATNAASLRGSKEDSQSQQYANPGSARKNGTTIVGRKNGAGNNFQSLERLELGENKLSGVAPSEIDRSGGVSKQTARKSHGHSLRYENFNAANGYLDESEEYSGRYEDEDESEEYGGGYGYEDESAPNGGSYEARYYAGNSEGFEVEYEAFDFDLDEPQKKVKHGTIKCDKYYGCPASPRKRGANVELN